MDENRDKEGNLSEEFRQLGKNLIDIVYAAWESPERKRIQEEVANGLSELGTTLRNEARHISDSPAGQRVRSEAEEIRQRIREGEMEAKARDELLATLHSANEYLRQAVSRLNSSMSQEPKTRPGHEEKPMQGGEENQSTPMKDTGHREVHPDDVEAQPDQGGERQEVHPDDVEL
jgi:hypothetical protein